MAQYFSPIKSVKPLKKRTCLKCNNQFDSTGPENRICPKCMPSHKRGSKAQVKEYKGRGKANST